MKHQSVTVIIPTYRPDEKFRKLLRGLEKQTVLPDRILIINTEEKLFPDWAGRYIHDEELKRRPEVIHISKADFDHGGTRDHGARMCDTQILMFMTMDAVPEDNCLIEQMLIPFEEEGVAAVYARQLPAKDCSVLERYTRRFNYGEKSRIKTKEDLKELGIKTFFCSNVCAAYRSDIYRQMGGFEHRTIFNEDMIYAGKLIREGYKIAYRAEAKVIHSHNYTGVAQLKRNFDLGVSQADHPDIFGMAASESEGIRMVKQTALWLMRRGKAYLLPKLVWQSGCKWIGYRLGKGYQKLPKGLIRRLTMNPSYWNF